MATTISHQSIQCWETDKGRVLRELTCLTRPPSRKGIVASSHSDLNRVLATYKSSFQSLIERCREKSVVCSSVWPRARDVVQLNENLPVKMEDSNVTVPRIHSEYSYQPLIAKRVCTGLVLIQQLLRLRCTLCHVIRKAFKWLRLACKLAIFMLSALH